MYTFIYVHAFVLVFCVNLVVNALKCTIMYTCIAKHVNSYTFKCTHTCTVFTCHTGTCIIHVQCKRANILFNVQYSTESRDFVFKLAISHESVPSVHKPLSMCTSEVKAILLIHALCNF